LELESEIIFCNEEKYDVQKKKKNILFTCIKEGKVHRLERQKVPSCIKIISYYIVYVAQMNKLAKV
jgi:hypothetical protein